MMRIFNSVHHQVQQIAQADSGSWLALTDPTEAELVTVSHKFSIDPADLGAALDEEESPRIDSEEEYTMIIVDIPRVEIRDGKEWYNTIPLSIIMTKTVIITVCSIETPLLEKFAKGSVRNFNTFMRSRFILQILYRNAQMYLQYLRAVDRKTDQLELRLNHAMQNSEIIELMELSKSLLYFTTSLKSNQIVLDKLTKVDRFKRYPDDEDLLGDVIVENNQAIEMASIYTGVLQGLMDAFGSIVSNNLNNVMRIFTIISIVISVPTLVFSAYGMNVSSEKFFFSGDTPGFLVVSAIALVLAAISAWILTKSKMFR